MIAFRVPRSGDLLIYVGHVIAPYPACGGVVEVWDQTLGCRECGRNLWDGDTEDYDFYTMHLSVFHDGHDAGDEDPATDHYDLYGLMPLGGWRFPSYPPFWHCTEACTGCIWCSYRREGKIPGR